MALTNPYTLGQCKVCSANQYDLFFPKDERIHAKCRGCKVVRELTHTEVNTYCGDW